MRRLSVALLVLSILLSALAVPVFAENPYEYVIEADSWTGFYSGGRTTDAPDTYNGYLALYPGGDWVSYDISNVKPGTYSVSFKYGIVTDNSNLNWKYTGLDIIIDGSLKAKCYLETAKSKVPDVISVPSEAEYIYISEGAKELKLKNHGRWFISLSEITLTEISGKDCSGPLKIYGQNVSVQYDDSSDSARLSGKSVSNEDFYDSDTNPRTAYTNTKTIMYSQEARILDNKDWGRYDISGFPSGVYRISVCYANKTDIPVNFRTEDTDGFTTTLTKSGTVLSSSDSTFNTVEAGTLPIEDDTRYLYLENKVGRTAQVYIKYILLEEVAIDVEVSINAVRTSTNEVELTVKNLAPKTRKNQVVIAGFEKDILKLTKIVSVELTPYKEYNFTEKMDLSSLDMLKVFVWEDLKNIKNVSAAASEKVVPEYTAQYLGDGFTRINLNATLFNAEEKRVFEIEIYEDSEFAVFIGQAEKLENRYTVSFEKDGVTLPFECDNVDETCYKYGNYVRVGAEKGGASRSVVLTKGKWKMYVTSKQKQNIEYIDIRSTIVSVGSEKIAFYPSDYNYIQKIGSAYNVNNHINSDKKARVPGCDYFADYMNDEISLKHEYGRGFLIRNDLNYKHNYKLDIKEKNVYKITLVGQLAPSSAALTESNNIAKFKLVTDNEDASEYSHTFEANVENLPKSPVMRCEKVVTFDKGIHTLCISSSLTGYVHQIIIEPYEPEKLTEDGAVFSLAKPEVERYMTDARNEYVKSEYADYKTSIAQNYCLEGEVNQSDRPQPVRLLWEELQGAKSYTLYISENENMENAMIISGINEPEYDVYNLYPGKTYYWKVADDNGSETDVKHFITKNTVRFIYAPNGGNIRDLGGWNGLNTGMAYRGGHLDGDAADGENGIADNYTNIYLNEEGINVFLNTLKIRTDLDLRGDLSSNRLGVNQIFAKIAAYTGAFSETGEYAKAIRAFSDINNYPIYFHCTGGADRTGTVAFIVEAIAGASEEDLAIDFELTGASYYGHRFRHREGFVNVVNAIKEYDGDTLQEKVTNYAIETLGLTRQEVSNIKSLLSGNKVVFKNVNNFKTGRNIISLDNLNGHTLSAVVIDGETRSAEINEKGEIEIEFPYTGIGKLVFDDGKELIFNVEAE